MAKHIPTVIDRDDPSKYLQPQRLKDIAAGLRELADWIETTDFPLPTTAAYGNLTATQIYADWIPDEGFIRRPGAAARLIGGRVEKKIQYEGGPFVLERQFSGGVRVEYILPRASVCEQVETYEEVERFVPADESRADILRDLIAQAEAELADLPKERRTVVEPVVEYVCPPSLLAAK